MQFLRDRHLNIAILISTSWHLVCIFVVTPVLLSGNIKKNSTTISFLGSILEKVVAVPEKPLVLDSVSLMRKIERIKGVGSREFSLRLPEAVSRVSGAELDKERFIFHGNKYKFFTFERHYRKKEKPKIRFKDVVITGQARDRIVLYKPDLFSVSIFPSYFRYDYNVGIRFKISRHGFVEDAECIESSGSPEIDQMAVRYMRKWQFVPHYEDIEDAQEGIVRIQMRP